MTAADVMKIVDELDAGFDILAPLLGFGELKPLVDALVRLADKAVAAAENKKPLAAEVTAADAAALAARDAKFGV